MDVSINCGRAGPHTGREKIGMVILMGTSEIRKYYFAGRSSQASIRKCSHIPISMSETVKCGFQLASSVSFCA